jgi:hypothetical protein
MYCDIVAAQLEAGARVCKHRRPDYKNAPAKAKRIAWIGRLDVEEKVLMKRTIAGILLLVGMGAGTMFAQDGYWRDRRDIRRDEIRIAHDRRDLRRDVYSGHYAAARHERRELGREYRDLGRDRRDLYWDRR